MRFGLQTKVVVGLLAVALVPLLAALLLVREITYASARVAAGESERLLGPLSRSMEAYREAVTAHKEADRAAVTLAAAQPEIARACDPNMASAEVDALLALMLESSPRASSASLWRHGTERGHAERRKVEVMRELDLEAPVPNQSGCLLRLRFGLPGRLLEDQQAIAIAVREQRVLGRVHGTLPSSYWNAFALLFGAVVTTVTAIAIVVARRTSRRILRLAKATAQVASGDLEGRVEVTGRDELADLGHAFNAMVADLRRSRAEIEYLHKIGAWQEVARRLAHEIKNPLTPIQLAVQQLRSKYAGDDPRFRQMLEDASEIVTEEVAGLRRLVDAFSSFAKLPRVEPEMLDLARVLEEVARDLPIVELLPPKTPLRVPADRMLLRRALVNLVDNAREAGATRVQMAWTLEKGAVRLLIDDDGPGVPADIAERIFDPYVTTKEHGTGLGLAIVKKTLLEHGGDIVLVRARSPLAGARFLATLPSAAAGAT